MAIRALEGLVPTWFTPPGQDEGAPVTRFKLQPLDGEQYADVASYMSIKGGKLKLDGQGGRVCLQHGLVGWDNFEDSNGPIEFLPMNFRLIPFLVRTQIISEIIRLAELSDEEKKT